MKYLLLVSLFTSTLALAQVPRQGLPNRAAAELPLDSASQLITYSGVVAVPKVSRHELFERAYAWLDTPQRGTLLCPAAASSVAGLLSAQGESTVVIPVLGQFSDTERLRYTVKLWVKEGRFRYELTDFFYQSFPSETTPRPLPIPAEYYLTQFRSDGTVRPGAARRQEQLRLEAQRLVASLRSTLGEANW